MDSIIQILATVMGIVMSLGYYPQAYKIWKSKSANDISIPSFVIFSVGTFTWFLYGVYNRDFTVASGFVLGVIGSWTILGLSIYYKKRAGGHE